MQATFDEGALARLEAILAARPAGEIDVGPLRRACVLILLVRDERGWGILFSHRSPDLPVHSGQISFPGGSALPGEELEAAALRETEEEVGIPAEAVRLIGRLDDVMTRTGFVVAPFVGVLQRRIEYVLQEAEVTSVYEVPLDVLLSRHNPEIRHLRYRDRTYPSYFYKHSPIEIWGLTGGILKSFLDLVRLVIPSGARDQGRAGRA
ncbi:MAG: NUDIX hydrolase [Thermoanaerobaculia bacterium]